MSDKNVRSNETSDEQTVKQEAVEADDEFTEHTVDDTPEFRPSVEQEINTKVETDHPETVVGRDENEFSHLPLAQEERIQGREDELKRISAKATFGTQDGREERTREVVVEQRREQTVEVGCDPRSEMEQAEVAEINQQSARITETVRGGPSRAAVSRGLAEKVDDGQSMLDATLQMVDDVKAETGSIVDIADVPDVESNEVDIEGTVIELWEPSDPSIQQVGLIADDSGKMKFTVWERSVQPMVREGQTVRLRSVKTNWYDGRCSLAVTGWSRIEFPERGRWWEEQ